MFLFTFLVNMFLLFCGATLITNIPIIFRSLIYNIFLTNYTEKHYKYFFEHIKNIINNDNIYSDENTPIRILDMGIGTGTALKKYLNKQKNNEEFNKLLKRIEYIGVDIDLSYLDTCIKELKKINSLNFDIFNVNLMLEQNRNNKKSTFGLNKLKKYENIGKYDFIFFSDSFSVIPNVGNYSIYNLLKYCQNYLLNPKGSICISTTINLEENKIKEKIKPNIVNFIGVDFGKYITFKEFIQQLVKYKIIDINNDYVNINNNSTDIHENNKKDINEYLPLKGCKNINEYCDNIVKDFYGIRTFKNIFDNYLLFYGNTTSFFTELQQIS